MDMKLQGTTFLTLLFFSLPVFLLQGQTPVISAPDIVTEPGSKVIVPIQTLDFKDITGIQFIVSWDSAALRFTGIQRPALDIGQENFGTSAAGSGVLRFLWFENGLQPVTLKDGDELFAIEFEVTGRPNSESPLAFKEDLVTRIEVYDRDFNRLNAGFKDGRMTILGTSGNGGINQPENARLLGCFPNPFSTSTAMDLVLEKATIARLSIFDAHGKLIYQEQRQLSSGRQVLELGREHFPHQGAYYCQLSAPEFLVTQKLIFLLQ